MADDKKSKPRPFKADLFSPSPSSLTALNLSADRTASTARTVPFIVPQIASSSPDPFQQHTHKQDSGQPFTTTDHPPSESQGLSQVDLSDETPTEDPREEQKKRHELEGVFSTPDQVDRPGATLAMSAELEINGEMRSSLRSGPEQTDLRTPQPARQGNPGTSQPFSPETPASGGGAGHNPYRAQNWQRATYTLPTSPQQFVPVPEPTHTQPADLMSVAPLPVSQPETYQTIQQPMYGQQQPMMDQTMVQAYWFFVDRRGYWTPFSRKDSSNIETAYQSGRSQDDSCFISTDGGRYDICLGTRTRQAVYWEESVSEVRRCTWFYKGETDRYFAPYEEHVAERLESEYQSALQSHVWNKRVELGDEGFVVMHNPSAIVHHAIQRHLGQVDWAVDDGQSQPRVVKRGFAEINQVYEGEFPVVDHLVFVVHGLGPAADARHQSVVESVDDFRQVAESLMYSHEMPGRSHGGRVEFLPVCWQSALSLDPSTVDKSLKDVSLSSISRLRDFNNHSMIDLLFYCSPLYFQTIVKHMTQEMNRLLAVFMSRNPGFAGTVSVMGHSLGACVLFDILTNQTPPGGTACEDISGDNRDVGVEERTCLETELPAPVATVEEALHRLGLTELEGKLKDEQIDMDSLVMCSGSDLKELGIPLGPRKKMLSFIAEQTELRDEVKRKEAVAKERAEKARKAAEEEAKRLAGVDASQLEPGTVRDFAFRKLGVGIGQLVVETPQLDFLPANLFTCGSPVGILLAIRGDTGRIGSEYSLPTCSAVFNIFHPNDPMASRLEPVIEPMLKLKPYLVPHHKGRKRFHLELKENLGRMGANLKRQIIQGVKQTWQQLNDFARSHYGRDNTEGQDTSADLDDQSQSDTITDQPVSETSEEEVRVGNLNRGRRIDYVLQEKPIESLNEYLFAFSSHFSYWQSEDTALLILKEVYSSASRDEPVAVFK